MVMMGSVFRYGAALGLVVFCMASGTPAAAQTGQVTGVVVDATGGVLPGTTVTLIGGPDDPRAAQTDARGRFAALVHGATRQGWSKGSDDAVTS